MAVSRDCHEMHEIAHAGLSTELPDPARLKALFHGGKQFVQPDRLS